MEQDPLQLERLTQSKDHRERQPCSDNESIPPGKSATDEYLLANTVDANEYTSHGIGLLEDDTRSGSALGSDSHYPEPEDAFSKIPGPPSGSSLANSVLDVRIRRVGGEMSRESSENNLVLPENQTAANIEPSPLQSSVSRFEKGKWRATEACNVESTTSLTGKAPLPQMFLENPRGQSSQGLEGSSMHVQTVTAEEPERDMLSAKPDSHTADHQSQGIMVRLN